MASLRKQLQHIVNAYTEEGQPWPATTRQIASWAIRNDLWRPQPSALINQCADQLAAAMREEFITDPQGRPVRAKHVARVRKNGQQFALWADIRTASRQHMEVALAQRRQAIVGDCRQLKLDADSYNENYNPGVPIQISLNFTWDVEELEGAA